MKVGCKEIRLPGCEMSNIIIERKRAPNSSESVPAKFEVIVLTKVIIIAQFKQAIDRGEGRVFNTLMISTTNTQAVQTCGWMRETATTTNNA